MLFGVCRVVPRSPSVAAGVLALQRADPTGDAGRDRVQQRRLRGVDPVDDLDVGQPVRAEALDRKRT